MASTKLTLGSIMGLVTTLANTATDSVEIVGNSVNKIKQEQAFEHRKDLAAHKLTYAATLAKETAYLLKEINAERQADPDFASLYDQVIAELNAA